MSTVSPLGIRAGHCTACGKLVWRAAQLQRGAWGLPAGTPFILWPRPDSTYAKVETPSGYAPGITYCLECAPRVGEQGPLPQYGRIVGYESPLERYEAWYAPEREAFYRTWLADALYLEGAEIDRLMALWRVDSGGHA